MSKLASDLPNERVVDALDNLRVHQRQLDADGVMVGVSREALNEVILAFGQLQQRRASVVTPEMVERIVDALNMTLPHTLEFDAESGGYYDTDLSREISDLTAALSVVSHETGDGEMEAEGCETRAINAGWTLHPDAHSNSRWQHLDPVRQYTSHLSSAEAVCSLLDRPAPTDETQGVKREDVEAWLHPRAGWASTAHHIVMNHCRIDGSDGGPIPLVRLARAATAEASLAAMREALTECARRFDSIRGAIESNQVVDKDVHGTAVRGRDVARAALAAGENGR